MLLHTCKVQVTNKWTKILNSYRDVHYIAPIFQCLNSKTKIISNARRNKVINL